MTLGPRLRKVNFTAHVAVSVGWMGAVAAYLALCASGLSTHDPARARASYLSMEVVAWFVIVPAAVAALLTGLVQASGTPWGLFRHYWILVKFLLTIGAITVFLMHIPAISRMAGVAAETTLSRADYGGPRAQLLVHAAGGMLLLVTITFISIFKPWGMTPFGRRAAARETLLPAGGDSKTQQNPRPSRPIPWWAYALLALLSLALALAALHLA